MFEKDLQEQLLRFCFSDMNQQDVIRKLKQSQDAEGVEEVLVHTAKLLRKRIRADPQVDM